MMSSFRDLQKYNHGYLQRFTHYVLENGIVIPVEASASMGATSNFEANASIFDVGANIVIVNGEAYIHITSSMGVKQTTGITTSSSIKSNSNLNIEADKLNVPSVKFRVNTNFNATSKLIKTIFEKAEIDLKTGFVARPLLTIATEGFINANSIVDIDPYFIDYTKDMSILKELEIYKDFEASLNIPVYKKGAENG